jgi:hypothetical protein
MKVAERIQDKFGRPFLVGGQEISIEASVGIS